MASVETDLLAHATNFRDVDLISDALPYGRLSYGELDTISNAINYAKYRSRSHHAVIRVYDDAGNVIEPHEHAGDFKEWSMPFLQPFDGYFPLEQNFSVMVPIVR